MPDSEYLPYMQIGDEPEGSAKRVRISKLPFTIGREPNNDLYIENTAVSRRHAEIRRSPEGQYYLVDARSKQGTWLNGVRIEECILAPGDEVRLARNPSTVLRFGLSPGADPTYSVRITVSQTRFLNPELINQVKTDPDKILRQLVSLYDLTNRMLPSTSLTGLFTVWMDTLFDFLPVQCGAILLWNQATGEFDVKLKRCPEDAIDQDISISSTITNQAFRENVAVMAVDALNDERFATKSSVVLPRIRSVLAAPISSKSRVWGVCYLYNSIPGKFQPEDLEYLMATARAAGLVIENLRHEELARITEELRETLAKLAETQDQLVHAEHLASLGTLTAGVAHEINNPLAAILQSLNTAIGRLSKISDEETRDLISKPLQRARDNGERIERIVRDLRAFSRAERVRGARADVRREIESALQILQPLAESRQIRLQADCGDLDWIEAPPTRLHQLLINIIQNAIHASSDGGLVEVSAGRAATLEGYGWIQIRDFGVGMTDEVKARIFDPLFTTKPVGVGAGLGLWVCQSIVKSLGGSIYVESEPARETIFTLNLPLPHGESDASSAA